MWVFLREAWELFYWSLWWPSKLEEKFGSLSGFNVLFTGETFNFRIFKQFLLVITCLSVPLVILIAYRGQSNDWLLLISILLSTCGVTLLYITDAFSVSIVSTVVYFYNPDIWQKVLKSSLEILFAAPTLSTSISLGAIGMISTSWIVCKTLREEKVSLVRNFPTLVNLLLGMAGSWIVTSDILGSLVITIWIALIISLLNREADDDIGSMIIASTIASAYILIVLGPAIIIFMADKADGKMMLFALGIFATVVSGTIAGILATGKTGKMSTSFTASIIVTATLVIAVTIMISLTIITLFLVESILQSSFIPLVYISSSIAFLLSSKRIKWLGLLLAVLIAVFCFEKFKLNSLLASLFVCLTYYRLVPDTAIFSLITLKIFAMTKVVPLSEFSLSIKKIYELGGELSWIPIPYHAEIIAKSFYRSPAATFPTIQRIRALSLPGYQITSRNLLPLIIANQLSQPKTTFEALQIATINHSFLVKLFPKFYPVLNSSSAVQTSGSPEVDLMLRRFQMVANDFSSALNTTNSPLRERGLDRVLQDLKTLQTDLPALGLKKTSINRWTSVIRHWQGLIQRERQEQNQKSQGELLNPFQFGNPLRPSHDTPFQGRRALADRLYRLVLDRDRPTIVLYGSRRNGKTSFLLNLYRFLPSQLIPIYIDMQSSAITNSEADFCYGLTRAIYRDTQSQGLTLPSPYSRDLFKDNPYGTLEDWLDEALPKIGRETLLDQAFPKIDREDWRKEAFPTNDRSRRLLLNLDEFEKIGAAIASGNLSLRLLDQLRNLIQHYDQLAFMFSGVQTLEELGPNWSSYFISIVPIEMGYLEPHEAEDLLRNPDPDFKMRYADNVIEEILRLTCCQPYLLQLIGSCLVTQANQTQTTIATLDLLEAAIPDAFTNGEPYFTNLWTEFTGTNAIEITAGKQILRAIAQNHPPDLTTTPAQAAHRRLLRFHLLKPNGTEIEIPLFQRWVIERAIDE